MPDLQPKKWLQAVGLGSCHPVILPIPSEELIQPIPLSGGAALLRGVRGWVHHSALGKAWPLEMRLSRPVRGWVHEVSLSSGRRLLAPLLRQVVACLPAHPEVGLRPADTLQRQRQPGVDSSGSGQEPMQGVSRNTEPLCSRGDAPAGFLNSHSDGFTGMRRVQHRHCFLLRLRPGRPPRMPPGRWSPRCRRRWECRRVGGPAGFGPRAPRAAGLP